MKWKIAILVINKHCKVKYPDCKRKESMIHDESQEKWFIANFKPNWFRVGSETGIGP